MKNRQLIVASFVCSFVLFGCATPELRLKSEDLQINAQMREKIGFTRATGSLAVADFSEDKDFANPVGVAKTGLFGKQTLVSLDISAKEFVRKSFIEALVRRGIEVSSGAPYRLSANLTEYKVAEEAEERRAENAGCVLSLNLVLTKQKSEEKLYKGFVSVGFSGTGSVLDATASVGPLLKACVETAVEKFLGDEKMRSLTGIKIKN